MHTVDLPGEIGTVDIPSDWKVELEDETTLVIYTEDCEDITLRISSISFSKPNSQDHIAKEYIQSRAGQEGHDFTDLGDKGVASYSEDSVEGGVPLTIHYWEIGSKNTLVILSATLTKAEENSRAAKEMLKHVPSMLESLHISKSHFTLEEDGRKLTGTEQSVDPVPQEVTPFGTEEMRWLVANLDGAQTLSIKYGSGGDLDPEELDRVYGRWANDVDTKESAEDIVNALGAAFGEYLVQEHGFCWMVLTDEYGTDFCVSHQVGHTKAFPCSSVEKRIETGAREFFGDLKVAILDVLRKAIADEAVD